MISGVYTMNIKKINSAKGQLTVLGDKSISHRAVMLGSLADGVSEIYGFLMGADCLSTIECFRKMGVKIDVTDSKVTIHGNGMCGLTKPSDMLYTGNSGTTTRLLCGILAGQDFDVKMTGDSSIEQRPMKRVTYPLSLMGAKIDGEYCPLHIHSSKLHSIIYDMPVASAQVKTAIILAGLYADGTTIINEIEKSRDHTELMLSSMGANIETNGLSISVSKTNSLKPQIFNIPSDISSAAFFMVLGAIMPDSEIIINNVGINPTRTGIIDVLYDMGADINLLNERIVNGESVADISVKTSNLNGTTIEGDIIPRLIDEIPIIAVAAAVANGQTVIKDAKELKVKETNRISAVVNEFKKCGIDIVETDDGMIINGGQPFIGADFKSYGDHRMAMCLTILAQLAQGDCTIDDPQCVDVSYPSFYDDIYKLGN